MKTFEDMAREGISLFRIRYPSPQLGASMAMRIAGDSVLLQEIAKPGPSGRRFWVKIKHDRGIESMSMEITDAGVIRNLAAPDGAMLRHH
jgi:hypothetical protein